MKIRKLNPGDARGCIGYCKAAKLQIWNGKAELHFPMQEKDHTIPGDTAIDIELLPDNTRLVNWSDVEYIDWVNWHDRRDGHPDKIFCEDCGDIGSIERLKNGNVVPLDWKRVRIEL